MNKKWIIKIALLLAYCIPFAFLSVRGDAASGTMVFYVVMIAGFASLCFGTLKTDNIPVIYLGNAMSFISSFIVGKVSGLEPMGYYFKPFTSYFLIFVISVFAFVLQMVLVKIFKGKMIKS